MIGAETSFGHDPVAAACAPPPDQWFTRERSADSIEAMT